MEQKNMPKVLKVQAIVTPEGTVTMVDRQGFPENAESTLLIAGIFENLKLQELERLKTKYKQEKSGKL